MTNVNAGDGTVERLYPLDGGLAIAPDRSVYTPGEGIGEPVDLPCNAYLIQRRGAWLLWDTGISDDVAAYRDGKIIAHDIRGLVRKSLVDQLAEIGLTPLDIETVILSHAHFDHVGNAALFGHATWFVQKREYEAMLGPDPDQFGYTPDLYDVLRKADVKLLEGDADLFGDDSVRIIFTPGHTPGHSSLLVRLAQSGPIVLSADVAHNQYNLDHRCVPTMNSDADETRSSMERLVAIVQSEKARLWINHDPDQRAAIPHAPAFFG